MHTTNTGPQVKGALLLAHNHSNGYVGGGGGGDGDGKDNPAPPKHQDTMTPSPYLAHVKSASAGPLGLFSFGLTTFVMGLYKCGAG